MSTLQKDVLTFQSFPTNLCRFRHSRFNLSSKIHTFTFSTVAKYVCLFVCVYIYVYLYFDILLFQMWRPKLWSKKDRRRTATTSVSTAVIIQNDFKTFGHLFVTKIITVFLSVIDLMICECYYSHGEYLNSLMTFKSACLWSTVISSRVFSVFLFLTNQLLFYWNSWIWSHLHILSVSVERRRRFNINDRIKELGALVPKSTDLSVKTTTNTAIVSKLLILLYYLHY